MVGCVGSCWTERAEGGRLTSGCDAVIFIQGCGTIFLPHRSLSVSLILQESESSVRIILFIAFSFCGMQLVAQSTGLTPRLLGIIVASISSGAGELSFLQLTHWYDQWALPGFAVGTGMAGLAGAYLYLTLTTWIGLTVHTSLNVSSVLSLSSDC
jgi:hypothetical protein